MTTNRNIWRNVQRRRDRFEVYWRRRIKRMLMDQVKGLAKRIDMTNYQSDLTRWIEEEPVKNVFIEMYRAVGSSFARDQFTKQEPTNDEWMKWFEQYVKLNAGSKITSITAESRKQALKIIKKIISESEVEGWGADVIATKIKKRLIKDSIEINKWRSLRIARTEVMTASNVGAFQGAKAIEDEYGIRHEKYWIPTYDNRTRDTHLVMEEQNPKMMDEMFMVGGTYASGPGDPALPAEEVINCRCAIAFKVIMP